MVVFYRVLYGIEFSYIFIERVWMEDYRYRSYLFRVSKQRLAVFCFDILLSVIL